MQGILHPFSKIAMSVWVFDDDAAVATQIGAGLGQDSVTFHLRRHGPGGAFDRYLDHFESLWTAAEQPRIRAPATAPGDVASPR
jgi:hypothetical protein